MNAPLIRVCVTLAAFLAAGSIQAKPLQLDAVPAKAVWLMHLDMDAARDSRVMQRAYERAVKMHPHLEKMAQMAAGMLGMDPRKDLHDVTAYGLDTDKRNNAVMVVRGKANREFLEAMVTKAPDHKTMEHRSHTLHAWTQKGWKRGKGGGEPVVAAFHKDDVMVFARTDAQVRAALDVLDAVAPAVAGDGPLAGRVRPGSILVARAAAVDPDTKCPVLKQGRGFRVALGEAEGRSFYRAKLDMKSATAADEAVAVAKGLAALASLRWGDDAGVAKLVSGLDTQASGETCTIAWDAAADDVWTVVEKAADEWEKRHRERPRRWGKDGCPMGECPMDKGNRKPGATEDAGPLRDDEF